MSGINDFGHFGTSNPNNVGGVAPASVGGTPASPLSISSIKQSELEVLAQMMVAGIPILTPPVYDGNGSASAAISGVSAGRLSLDTERMNHDIISKMWDSYIENIRQVAERIKKEDIKKETLDANKPGPMSSTEYFTFLMAVSATSRADEVAANTSVSAQFATTYNNWLVNPIDSGNNISAGGAYPSSSFIAGSVISSPDVIKTAIGADSALIGLSLSSSPVGDAVYAVGPASGLSPEAQAAAAMVAALLYGGALKQATIETMAAGAKPQYDLNFAVNFAKQIMAIVTKDIGKEEQTDPRRSGQNNMIRLMLSSMALNMVYRAAYGGMAGKDLESLLSGDLSKIPESVKGVIGQLVSLVNFYIDKSPGSRDELVARLSEYVDSKESVESMLSDAKTLGNSLPGSDVIANRMASIKN